MKKLIFLLLSNLAFAQINIDNVCKLTLQESNAFSAEIIKNASKPYKFFKTVEMLNAIDYIYIPEDVAEADANKYGYDKYSPIDISFQPYMYGQNKDLQIPGEKRYRFQQVDGQFLNLFNFWKKYYRPDITLDNYKEFDKKEFRKGGMLMKFVDNGDGDWYITTFYCN